jgi:hypothetical protein
MKINWRVLLRDLAFVVVMTAVGVCIGLIGGFLADGAIYFAFSLQSFAFNITPRFGIVFGVLGLYYGIANVIKDFL